MRSVNRLLPVVSALAFGIVTAGCSSEQATPTTPTVIAPPSVVETFTGTLITLGTNMHTFTVSQLGEVNVTLKATTLEPTSDAETGEAIPPPDPTAVPALTLAVGSPTTSIFGPVCATLAFGGAPFLVETKAAATPQIKGSALPGNLCVSFSDPNGHVTNVVDYTIVVAHP